MYHNFISVLSFEDLGLYRKHHNQTRLEERTDLGVTLGLLSIECIILFICLFQLLRFILNCPGRLYLKKVVHALIALEMLVCMLQAVNIPSFYEEFLHEATFIFCSLIYFNVLLFWYDFYCKLSKGEGITFLRKRLFLVCIALYIILHIGAFITTQYVAFPQQPWRLPPYVVWYHLAFYTCIMLGIFYVAARISGSICGLFFNVRKRFFKKTAKLLSVVGCCFVIRFLGTLLFVFLHHNPTAVPPFWETQPGFVMIYMCDRIIPVVVFMILMRKLPSSNIGTDSDSFSNLYTPVSTCA